MPYSVMKKLYYICFINKFYLFVIVTVLFSLDLCSIEAIKLYTKEKKLQLREEVRSMFQHAYEGYLRYASDYDELRPLTCDGVDTWGSYSLTLIDALDTLATMGNYTEFRRVVQLLEKKMNFDKDINVSVFETNIRIVGGLLSAHLLTKKAGLSLEKGWPCQGPLLRMAENVAKRLLPAFDTATGMPYGTINLLYGVPRDETSITCTAGVGTLLIEFGTLSRLTGNPIYEKVALNALHGLWQRRSSIGLFGNHIDVQTGKWTALDSGIGAGVDSFFEYLVKSAILLQRPELLQMFHEARHAIDKYLRHDDWYVWVGMSKGQITLPIFQSLEAFWPGLLAMLGDLSAATKTFTNYASVWHKYGFLPEFYNIPHGEASPHRESYPLRPELVESALYLYRATKNEFMLEVGESILRSIEHSAKTKCGYATIRNVITHEKENRMESFFLAETTKYLYLLFDEENFLHNDGESGDIIQGPYGECVINSGPYIFNTEAHPIDMSALYCCHDVKDDLFDNLDVQQFHDSTLLQQEQEWLMQTSKASSSTSPFNSNHQQHCQRKQEKFKRNNAAKQQHQQEQNIVVDIEVFDENNEHAANILIDNFEKIKNERAENLSTSNISSNNNKQDKSNTYDNAAANSNVNKSNELIDMKKLVTIWNLTKHLFKEPLKLIDFVQDALNSVRIDYTHVIEWNIFEKNITHVLGTAVIEKEFQNTSIISLWHLYCCREQYLLNVQFLMRLKLLSFNENDFHHIQEALIVLNGEELEIELMTKSIRDSIKNTMHELSLQYRRQLLNTTAIQEFLYYIIARNNLGKGDEMNTSFHQYAKLLTEDEILSLPLTEMNDQEKLEFFAPAKHVLQLKKRTIQTFQRLQALIVENNKRKSIMENHLKEFDANADWNSKSFTASHQKENDKVERRVETHTEINNSQKKLFEKNLTKNGSSLQQQRESENTKKSNIGEGPEKSETKSLTETAAAISNDDTNHSQSVWSQFLRTILRKAQPKRQTFNVQELLRKTEKSLQQYEQIKRQQQQHNEQPQQLFHLFTCENPKFIERFAYRHFYP